MNSRKNFSSFSMEISERLQGVPKLVDFVEQVEQIALLEDPFRFSLCAPLFRKLLQSNFLTDLVNYELVRFDNEEIYMPEGTNETEMTIVTGEHFSLSMKILKPTTTVSNYLYNLTEHTMVGVANFGGNGIATLETFKQPNPYPNEILDRKKRIVDTGLSTLNPGDFGLFHAAVHIFNILPPEKLLFLLFFKSKSIVPLRWEYNKSTLFPTRAIASDLMSSRLEFTAWMLSELSDDTSIPALKSLLQHKDHFVRWAAIRSIMRLSFADGVNFLHIALEDAHPHVRNAARRSLDKLSDLQRFEQQ
jgi:HEAT repeats